MLWSSAQGFHEPAEPWFWSPRKSQAADKNDEDESENQQNISRERGDHNAEDDENISEEEEIEFEVLNFFFTYF
jgi:hypothetical protein